MEGADLQVLGIAGSLLSDGTGELQRAKEGEWHRLFMKRLSPGNPWTVGTRSALCAREEMEGGLSRGLEGETGLGCRSGVPSQTLRGGAGETASLTAACI